MYVYIYICIHVHMYIKILTYAQTHTDAYIRRYVCMHTHEHERLYSFPVDARMQADMRIRMHMCMQAPKWVHFCLLLDV